VHNRRLLRFPFAALIFLAIVFSSACSRPPVYYPPPEQRQPIDGPDDTVPKILVEMSDPDIDSFIVKDISSALEGGSWRWTGQRPTVKVLLTTTRGLKFVTDFTLWEGNMKQTGPVVLSFYVAGHLLDRVRYDTPAYKHFEKAVPPEWLQTVNETELSIEIDKIFVAEDGNKLGFILTRIGFAD
jgi:hypothetical protein